MIIRIFVSIMLITLLMEIRSKRISFFYSDFPTIKQRNGISITVIHHSIRSGQGEEGKIVGKISNVDINSTCLIRRIQQLTFLFQVHLTFHLKEKPSSLVYIYLFMTLLI